MKSILIIFISLVILSGCAGKNNVKVKGSNNGVGGGVSRTVSF